MKSKNEIITEAAAMHPVVANPIATGMNVVTKEEYTQLAQFVFQRVVDVLSKSYGPYGSMTLINRAGYRFSTKDGWRILMYTVFDNNQYYQAIHRMIFEVCEQMNDTVGDGTTTVILIANRIYEKLVDVMDEIDEMDLPPRDIFRAFDSIVEKITEKLKSYARKFTLDDVRSISRIATNDDVDITNCLCRLYERNPNAEIQIMESNKIGVSIEEVDGLKIPVMLLDRIYVNNQVEKCCDVNDAIYLVFNHKIGENAITKLVLPAENAARKLKKRLVVIAPSYEESVMVGFWLKKATDEFRSTGTSVTVLTHYKSSVMGVAGAEDLAILLDTHPIDARMIDAMTSNGKIDIGTMDNGRVVLRNYNAAQEIVLGIADKAKLGYDTMSFFSGLHPVSMTLDAQKEAVKAEIKGLEDTMTVTEKATSMKLSNLKKRLARLEMKMSVIYFGADSAFDKEMIHDTIEDGVRALESARAHGVIKGSQYDLITAVKSLLQESTSKLDKLILGAILHGIQTTLITDLYSKSKAFLCAFNDYQNAEDRSSDNPRYLAAMDLMTTDFYNIFMDDVTDANMNPINLITMEEDPNLIASTETDICAIKASIELIKILIAGNQLLMVD